MTLNPYESLKITEFRSLCLARFCITVALQIQAVCIGWQLYSLTNDPLALGLIGLTEAIPALSIALFAGYVADNFERRSIILTTIAVLVLSAALLVLATLGYFSEWGLGNIAPFYIVIFFTGLARGFLHPTTFAFLAQIVPPILYANATTWSSTAWQIGAVSGPVLGGFLYAFYGPASAYLVVASLLVCSIALVQTIKPKRASDSKVREPILSSIKQGVKFVFAHKIILSALTLDLFAVLFGGAVALLPIYARDVLMVGPTGLGWLRAAPSIGSILMALCLVHYPLKERAGQILFLATAGFGLSIIAFGISTSFLLSLFALFMSGACDNISVVIRATIVQTLTPDEMRGRVASVNSIFIGSSNELGAFESGVAARLLGTVPSVVFGGCMTLLVVTAVARWAPQLKRLKL